MNGATRYFWVLLCLYPSIHLAAANTDPVPAHLIALAAGACLGLGVVIRAILFAAAIRDPRADCVTAILVGGSLLFGHSASWVSGTWADRSLVLLPCWAALMTGMTVLVLRRDPPSPTALRVAAVFSIVLFLIPAGMLGFQESRQTDPPPHVAPLTLPPDRPTPDIVVIVLDRYAGLHGLRRGWEVDNAAFYSALSQRGFSVKPEAQANYPTTAHAFASMLHMDYLDLTSVRPDSRGALRARIAKNPVEATLVNSGYHIIHGSTQFGVTSGSEHAHTVVTPHPLPEYLRTLYEMTVFHRIATAVGIEHFRQRLWAFEKDKLLNISSHLDRDGPTFVFIHSMIPHWPFLFEADGSLKPPTWERHRDYPDQIAAANRLLLESIDTLLKRPDPPVILLLSEEGPHPPSSERLLKRLSWGDATQEEICVKYNILSALRIPGRPDVGAPGSPVNAFRILFSEVFGMPVGRLPNRSFRFRDTSDYYTLFPVPDPVSVPSSPR
jgi:hypothetical protein